MTGGLKMVVNVAAHTSHIFLGNAPRYKNVRTWMMHSVNGGVFCKSKVYKNVRNNGEAG